ncbi:MAG: MATE family efflux transporter [Endozoicomonas sp.]
MVHFVTGRGHLKLNLQGLGIDRIGKILTMGLPTFFMESAGAASALLVDFILFRFGGELYVSAYSIVMNVGLLVLFILMGIGQACQPIFSFNHGAGRSQRVKEIRGLSICYALSLSVVALMFMLFSAEHVAGMFTESPELILLGASALKLYFLAFLFMGLNLVIVTMFQDTENVGSATVLSLLRGFVFLAVGLLILPQYLPETGVWLSVIFAETLTLIFSGAMLKRFQNSPKGPITAECSR